MADTEKITININVVDLGKIDLLVEEGFYTNRTDFIRTSIRRELGEQKQYIESSITRKHSVVGILLYNASDLESYRERGEMLSINLVGFLKIADDVTPKLAEASIEHIKVFGVSVIPKAVQYRLLDLGRMPS